MSTANFIKINDRKFGRIVETIINIDAIESICEVNSELGFYVVELSNSHVTINKPDAEKIFERIGESL